MSIDNQDIKQLINILQKMLVDNEEDAPPPTKAKSGVNKSSKSTVIKTRNKKLSSNEHYNKFVDMPEKNMHKEDTEIDKKLNVNGPTPRTRSFNFIDVVCRVCGKTESVNPAIVDNVSRYKCNTCSTTSG